MIYFNCAATSLQRPKEVIEQVVYAMQHMGNAVRGADETALLPARTLYMTRKKLAELFRINDPGRIAFTTNATESLNLAIKGLLKSGDHIIYTQLDHNSILRPVYEMEQNGVTATMIPCDYFGSISYDQLEKAIEKQTKMMMITHCSNVTGTLLDLEKIGAFCQKHKILLVVDAAQSAGVFPIDVTKQKIDILCFTGHKSLFGPQGTGGIYVREGILIKPLKTGGSGTQTFSKKQPGEMPDVLEAGTMNTHGIAGLLAGVTFVLETGVSVIHEKEQELMWLFYNGIKTIPNVIIYGDFSGVERGSIVTFNIGACDSKSICDELATVYGIVARGGGHCAPQMHIAMHTVEQGAVRFSFSFFNTMEEVEQAIQAVSKIAKDREC